MRKKSLASSYFPANTCIFQKEKKFWNGSLFFWWPSLICLLVSFHMYIYILAVWTEGGKFGTCMETSTCLQRRCFNAGVTDGERSKSRNKLLVQKLKGEWLGRVSSMNCAAEYIWQPVMKFALGNFYMSEWMSLEVGILQKQQLFWPTVNLLFVVCYLHPYRPNLRIRPIHPTY